MKRRINDIACVCRIHWARLKAEAGPFLLAAFAFPAAMYLFASAVGDEAANGAATGDRHLRFLAGSIVFSLSLTAVSWLGYLLLENRFTGRLKLFATLPLAPSSYVLGIVVFAIAQAALGTGSLLAAAMVMGAPGHITIPGGVLQLAALVVLTVLCVCGLAVIIAARARSFSEGSLMTDAVGVGLVFLAPIYYPPNALPRALQMISLVMPTTYAARGVRTTLAGGTGIGGDVLALALLATLTLSLGFHLMKWRED